MPEPPGIRRRHIGLALVLCAAGVAQVLAASWVDDWAVAFIPLFTAPVALLGARPVEALLFVSLVAVATPHPGGTWPPDLVALGFTALSYGCGMHARDPQRRGLPAVVVAILALQIAMGFADAPNFELGLLTLPAWWIGWQLRRRAELVLALVERNQELEVEQDAFVDLSVQRERARIARELHDIVAHQLAVIAVQAAAGRMGAPAPDDLTAERFGSIREAAEQALAEMGRLVDVLQTAPNEPADLGVLLEQARSAGLRVECDPLPALSAELAPVVLRVVQEGLTNVLKHAPGAEVGVRVVRTGAGLHVQVSNGPPTTSSPLAETGAGLGLTGMRERIEALGGTFEAGPRPGGGWLLESRLPDQPDAVAAAPATSVG